MPRIDIQRRHTLGQQRARAVVDDIAVRMRDKFGAATRWDGDTLHFTRSGVDGTIAVGTDEVRVAARLGMLLAPLKPVVEEEIRRKLDEHFA